MKNVFKILAVGLLSVCTLTSCNPDKKYTVTEAEWKALAEIDNYTIEYYVNDELIFDEKYDGDAIQLGDSYVIFVGDKQYYVSEYKEYDYVATDCTYLEFNRGQLLAEYEYSDFEYDKESKSYVNIEPTEEGCVHNIRFENGLPVSFTCTLVDNSTTPATVDVSLTLYKDIRTTTVTVPEFLYESEIDNPYVYTVDEETWNSFRNVTNYSSSYYVRKENFFETYEVEVDGNKILFDGKLYIYEDDKIYLLEEKDSKWVATEAELLDTWYFINWFFYSFDYNNFTYDEAEKEYRYSTNDGKTIYTVLFRDNELLGFDIDSIDENGKESTISYSFDDFNKVTIEVPEYTKANS